MTTKTTGAVDPRQVDELVRYGIGELSRAGMGITASDGRSGFARISVGALASRARQALKTHPSTASDLFAEYVAAIIRAERNSYERTPRIPA